MQKALEQTQPIKLSQSFFVSALQQEEEPTQTGKFAFEFRACH
jgi:hypothetical protein